MMPMASNRDKKIRALIDRLMDEMNVARDCELDLTVRLLQMAILDLHTITASISDDDFRFVMEALNDDVRS